LVANSGLSRRQLSLNCPHQAQRSFFLSNPTNFALASNYSFLYIVYITAKQKTGSEAVKKAAQLHPDLIVIDS